MIKSITLKNYRVYEDKTFNFKDLEIISGRNGTGKTTIVEAIGFALFGSALQRGKAKEWIKDGKSDGSVSLCIDSYTITRSSKLAIVEDAKGNVIAKNNTGINEWVEKTYGLTADLYKTSFYIGQKDIGAFAALSPLERTKRVEKLLRIDKLDSIKTQAKEIARTTQTVLATYNNKLEFSNFDEEALNNAIGLHDTLAAQQNRAQEELEQKLIEQGKYAEQFVKWKNKLRLERLFEGIYYDLEVAEANYKEDLIYNANVANNNKLLLEKQTLEKKLSSISISEIYFNSDITDIMNHEKAINTYIKLKKELDKLLAEPNKHDVDLFKSKYNIAKELYNTNKNIPILCPTCGQDWPVQPTKDLSILKEEMNKAQILLRIITAENRAYEITEQLVKPEMTKEETAIAINSITRKSEYLRLKDLEALDLELQEECIVYNLEECRLQNSFAEELDSLKDVVEPEPIDIAGLKQKLKNREIELERLQIKISQELSYQQIQKEFSSLRDEAQERLEYLKDFIKFIDKYRKAFGNNIIPLIEKNVSTIVAYLTEDKYSKIKINPDYGIDNFEYYSGSEQDSINFALRLAIAQISKLGSFKTMILDEIAASFDNQKEKLLLEVLKQQSNQLIYISHGDI